ncbi:MAG: PfkB family carbohydrate kinase [Candidatus Hermodarchaeota archaeon]
MSSKKNKVLVLGSLAFDYIMGFEENFCNAVAIDHEKGDYQSTITANSRIQHFGGTAGNIAYNLGLLKVVQVSLVGAVGPDFDQLGYREHIERFDNIELGVDVYDELFTAACYIVNDIKTNQMIIFHGGALDKCRDITLKSKINDPEEYLFAINSTQSVEAMTRFQDQLFELKIPIIFDPGQVTPLFPKELLLNAINKTEILIGNQYEIKQIEIKLESTIDDIIKDLRAIIITRGEEGSELIYKDDKDVYKINIPICKPKEIKDTTGAGDGYRAGILSGLSLGMTLLDSCRLGSVIGSFVIETSGPQTHFYHLNKIKKRFYESYGYLPQELEIIT